MKRTKKIFDDCYTQIHKDHKKLMDNFREFRNDPSSVVYNLQYRMKMYRQVQDKTYLFSDIYPRKAVRIFQKQPPQQRIRQLVGILQGQTASLGQTIQVPKLYEYASKICQTICRKIPQQIHFKPETSQLIRNLIEEDQSVKFPKQIYCLVSVSFNYQMESLLTLLIDDDLSARPNRQILLNPDFKYVGICSAIPQEYKHLKCTVYLLTDKAVVLNSQIASDPPQQTLLTSKKTIRSQMSRISDKIDGREGDNQQQYRMQPSWLQIHRQQSRNSRNSNNIIGGNNDSNSPQLERQQLQSNRIVNTGIEQEEQQYSNKGSVSNIRSSRYNSYSASNNNNNSSSSHINHNSSSVVT